MRQIAQSKSSLHSQGGPEKPGRCGNTGSVWGMTCPLGGTLGDLDPARAGSGQHVTAWPGVPAVPGGSVQRTMRDLNLREDGLLRRDLKKVSPKFQALKNYTYTMMNFPGGPVVGNPPANAGDMGSIPGLGGFYSPLGI